MASDNAERIHTWMHVRPRSFDHLIGKPGREDNTVYNNRAARRRAERDRKRSTLQ